MMLVTYDSSADAAYLYLREAPVVSRSVFVDDDRVVDFDEDGEVVGIEILSASSGFEVADIIERFGLQARAPELLQAVKEFRPAKAV